MMFRGFIAVDIHATADIKVLLDDLLETGAELNMVRPENIHITVKFLGDTQEELIPEINSKIEGILKEEEPFRIKLKGVGAFPKLDYMKVIWIGVEEVEELSRIAHRIEEELVPIGFPRENRSFSPHITVARVRGGRNKNRLKAVVSDYESHEFGELKVNKIILKRSELKSEGPEYFDLREYYMG